MLFAYCWSVNSPINTMGEEQAVIGINLKGIEGRKMGEGRLEDGQLWR